MLIRLARTCFHRRRIVTGLWVLVFVGAIVGGSSLAGEYANSGRLPGTDSQHAYDLLKRDFPQRTGDEGQIVFADVTKARAAIDAYLRKVPTLPGVAGAAPLRVSPQGKVAVAQITLASGSGTHPKTAAQAVRDAAKGLDAQGVRVAFAGGWFTQATMPSTEIIGILAAVIVLLVAFGSLIAMGLPIVTALLGIAISLVGVGVIANFVTTPSFAPQVAAMIGIGVGIDYALFIVTRYREALHRTNDVEAAVIEAINTSGRAVVFAGLTVMVSVLGMFLMGLNFLHGLALGTSLAVVIAMLGAVTLLPALLGFVGFTIDRLHVGKRDHNPDVGFWHRWSTTVQRRPWPIAVFGFAVLILIALPMLSLRLGSADAHNDPKSSTTHQAYDLIAQGFGPGANGPILVVASTKGARPGSLDALSAELRRTPGVANLLPFRANPGGTAALSTLFATTGPQAKATEQLVHRLRDHVLPTATQDTGLAVHLGGQTASAVDFSDVIGARLPIFVGGVLGISFLLLLVVFRSVLVPLKAVIMNLLSIGAAYGVIVATFQWGWGGSVLGVSAGPIEAWVPMMLFAIVFGLSMDYEVFLLSAVREHYERTHDNGRAVADGLASTARVITAAALIMVCVFGSFVVSDIRALKLIGLGLAVAVAIDATIVRIVLVPATMELLGDANWWLPRWLDRILPHVHIDEQHEAEPPRIPRGPAGNGDRAEAPAHGEEAAPASR